MTRSPKFAPAYLAAYLVGFLALWLVLRPAVLIVLLNGFFCGAIIAALVAYTPLFWGGFRGRLKYADAGLFVLALFLLMVGVTAGVLSSVQLRGSGADVASPWLTAYARYTVTHALVLMVYAPDFGSGLFSGRDRKFAAASLILGLVVALGVIYIQAYEVLA